VFIREQALDHETAVLYGLVPLLLVMTVWLGFRIVAIRRYNRALEAEEAEAELTPIAEEPQAEDAHHA
jgi:hypothetical protein